MLVHYFTTSLTLVRFGLGEFVINIIKYAEFHYLILALAFTRSMACSSTRSVGGNLPQIPHPGSAIDLALNCVARSWQPNICNDPKCTPPNVPSNILKTMCSVKITVILGTEETGQ